jgi:hypothetical protein
MLLEHVIMELQGKRGSSRSDKLRHDDSKMLNGIGHPIVPRLHVIAYMMSSDGSKADDVRGSKMG